MSETLSSSRIERIAHLARLALTPDEVVTLRQDINGILPLFDELDSLDVSNIDHLAVRPSLTIEACRPDLPQDVDMRESMRHFGPNVDQDTAEFLVPLVVDSNE